MKTILIIEDDALVREMCEMLLADAGYRVITAGDGLEGVELARSHFPDLILCDVNMPKLDGRGVLKMLREDPDLGARQIVLMTGNPQEVAPRRGMELGADDFLMKPFSMTELTLCVEARLNRAHVHWRVEDRVVAEIRSTLSSILPHEFFTPLNGILGSVAVLREDIAQWNTKEVAELLDDIEQSGWRLHRTLRNVLFLLELQRNNGAPEALPALAEGRKVRECILKGLAAATRRNGRDHDVRIELGAVPVRGLAGDIEVMVEELADNACQYSRGGTEIEVVFTGEGRLTVSDRGRGMTPGQIAQVGAFRQFDRRRFEQQGLGLGLLLTQKLAARCGARLQIESEPGSGTRVEVQFSTAS